MDAASRDVHTPVDRRWKRRASSVRAPSAETTDTAVLEEASWTARVVERAAVALRSRFEGGPRTCRAGCFNGLRRGGDEVQHCTPWQKATQS